MTDSPNAPWPLTSNEDFLGLLWQALGSEHGLLVQVSDLDKFRARIYSVRRESLDDRLAALHFINSPIPGGNLCIIKEAPPAFGRVKQVAKPDMPDANIEDLPA